MIGSFVVNMTDSLFMSITEDFSNASAVRDCQRETFFLGRSE
jgi:hypothetical protein